MKRLLFVVLNILSCASPSFGMLDEPFVQDARRKVLCEKNPNDFRVKNSQYQGISNLHPFPFYRQANFPKVTIIRPYYDYGYHADVPFLAELYEAYASLTVNNIHSQQLPNYIKVYFFVVQSMYDENEGGAAKFHRVVPHYFVHSDTPACYEGKNYMTSLKWTAVPGGKGHVIPANANHQNVELLVDSISTHNHPSDPTGLMVTSGNVMHLQGVRHHSSVDLTSLVAFTDEQNNNISAITYHWLLNNEDLLIFSDNISMTNTLRELVYRLESIPTFVNLVDELKKYVGITIDPELHPTGFAAKIESLPEKFIVTTDYNANASYQLRSNRFAIATGQKISVPYNITIAEGSRVSLGLLNTNGNEWYGDELVWGPGSYQGVFERIVPANETTAEVVFRNYHLNEPKRSIFTVNYATVKVDNQPVEVQLTPTDSPMDISRKPGPMRVTTDHNEHASYQLESKRFSVKGGERIRILYDITVEEEGVMSFGLLSSSRTWWYPSQVGGETEELILKTGRHKGIFERIVPEGEAETSLVFRNHHLGTPGQTTFTITDLKIERGR